MATYEEAFNADTARGKAARTKYGGDLAKFTTAAKAYNTKQAASKKKNVVTDDQGNKGNPSGTGPGPMTSQVKTKDMGGAGVLQPKSTTSLSSAISSGGGYTKIGTDTRENASMANTINNTGASKQKNVSRGAYTGDQTATTSGGSLKIGGKVTPVTTTETYGNVTKPGGGTGFIPQGKGSTATSYAADTPDEKPEFESAASKRSDQGPRVGGGQQKSPWYTFSDAKQKNVAGGMRSGVESGSNQGVEQQKTRGEISKREHSKLQAKNVLGADASKKELRQKGRDIRKTSRATDRTKKSVAKAQAAQKAGDARLGLDLSSASKRDYSKTDSASKKVNDKAKAKEDISKVINNMKHIF